MPPTPELDNERNNKRQHRNHKCPSSACISRTRECDPLTVKGMFLFVYPLFGFAVLPRGSKVGAVKLLADAVQTAFLKVSSVLIAYQA
jgi:hypothetical protein